MRIVAEAAERPNVIGEVGGSGRTLLFNAHLDTKPPGDVELWETPPYDPVVRDGRLHGLGAADMKGALAAMVYAGAALAESAELAGTLRIVLTADEEAGSRFGARFLARTGAVAADAGLVGEPSGVTTPWEFLAVASRGISAFRIRARGTQLHSSLSDRLPAVNASVSLARVLDRMSRDFRLPSGATANLGVTLRGGVFFGVYPGEAEAGVDIRTVPGMTLEDLRRDVAAFLERLRREDPTLDVDADWVPELEWLPPAAIDPDHPLVVAAAEAAGAVLARKLPRGTMPAFTDAAVWSEAGIPCIPALGPGLLSLAHRPNEWVAVSEIVEAARIYVLTGLRYLGVAGSPGPSSASSRSNG